MSEEEIIKKLELMEYKYTLTNNDDKAIDGILDLYKKEKEKNKELEERLKWRINYCLELEKDLFENASNFVVSKDEIKEILNKHKKLVKLAEEQIQERIIIADSDSLNAGRKEAHLLIISDLEDVLKEN